MKKSTNIERIINFLENSLEKAEIEAKKSSKDLTMQNYYQIGWLQGSIKSAIKELKNEINVK